LDETWFLCIIFPNFTDLKPVIKPEISKKTKKTMQPVALLHPIRVPMSRTFLSKIVHLIKIPTDAAPHEADDEGMDDREKREYAYIPHF
jgi:hypothetical protein